MRVCKYTSKWIKTESKWKIENMIENKSYFTWLSANRCMWPSARKRAAWILQFHSRNRNGRRVAIYDKKKKQWKRNTFIGCYLSYLLSSTDSDSAWADVSWNRIAKARMRNRRRSVLEDSICTLFRLDLGRIKADLFSC